MKEMGDAAPGYQLQFKPNVKMKLSYETGHHESKPM
jgi:hypothetical protein